MGSGSSGYNIRGTSGSEDRGFSGGAAKHRSISENLFELLSAYPMQRGRFGKPGSSSDVRRLSSDDPLVTALDFYRKASYGGVERSIGGKGWCAEMADGTFVTIRFESSSDGSPVVDINVGPEGAACGVKTQKIHFIKE